MKNIWNFSPIFLTMKQSGNYLPLFPHLLPFLSLKNLLKNYEFVQKNFLNRLIIRG
jgi:hypothetical protein